MCGSNIGELIGALSVFLFGDMVPTPIPWLRLDSFLLLLIWVLPFYLQSDPTTVRYIPDRTLDVYFKKLILS